MKKLITILCASCAVLSAHAQPAKPAMGTDAGFYVGVQLGDANSAFAGYQIDRMWGIEGIYSSYNSNVTSIGAFGVAKFPMNFTNTPPFYLFGRAGLVRTTVKVPSFCIGTFCTPSASATENDFVLGAGAQYDFNRNLSARVGADFNGYKSSSAYISGIYKF
jgi:opacity protein-like surface antigen